LSTTNSASANQRGFQWPAPGRAADQHGRRRRCDRHPANGVDVRISASCAAVAKTSAPTCTRRLQLLARGKIQAAYARPTPLDKVNEVRERLAAGKVRYQRSSLAARGLKRGRSATMAGVEPKRLALRQLELDRQRNRTLPRGCWRASKRA